MIPYVGVTSSDASHCGAGDREGSVGHLGNGDNGGGKNCYPGHR